ncbi:hypothetical protein VTN02DRAFT_5064 [Thermoascus thermophilus]
MDSILLLGARKRPTASLPCRASRPDIEGSCRAGHATTAASGRPERPHPGGLCHRRHHQHLFHRRSPRSTADKTSWDIICSASRRALCQLAATQRQAMEGFLRGVWDGVRSWSDALGLPYQLDRAGADAGPIRSRLRPLWLAAGPMRVGRPAVHTPAKPRQVPAKALRRSILSSFGFLSSAPSSFLRSSARGA